MSKKLVIPSSTNKRKQAGVKTVAIPAAVSIQRTARPPIMSTIKDGVHIRRKEFVGTLTNSSATFALTPLSIALPGYDLNPATATMFPWLSTVARSFERFRFNKCAIHFIPGNPTTAVGRFYAAVDYDYDDAPNATSKAQLMGNITSSEMSVWQGGSLVLSPEMMNRDIPYRYISATSRTSMVDSRFSYAGFLMCAYDSADLTLKMDMWVEYDVELVTPVLDFIPIENTAAPATAQAVANAMSDVTKAVGTSYAGSPLVVVGTNNPVKVVRPGTADCPLMTIPTGGTYFQPDHAFDISPMRGNGTITVQGLVEQSGKTPEELLAAGIAAYFKTGVVDSLGNYLGLVTDSGIDKVENVGPFVPSQIATADKFVQQATTFGVRSLLNKYPTARFLAPILTNAGAAIATGFANVGLLVNA